MERFSSRNLPLYEENDFICPSGDEDEGDESPSSPGASGEASTASSSQAQGKSGTKENSSLQLRHRSAKGRKGVHVKAIQIESISSDLPSNLVDNLNSTGVNLISLLESLKIDSFGDSFNNGESSCSLYASRPPLTYLNMRKIVNRFLSSSFHSEIASKLSEEEEASFQRQNKEQGVNSLSEHPQLHPPPSQEDEDREQVDEQVKSLVNTKSEKVAFGKEKKVKKLNDHLKCGWKIQLPLNLPNSILLTHYTNGVRSNVNLNIEDAMHLNGASVDSIEKYSSYPINESPEGYSHPISTFPWQFNFFSNGNSVLEKENNVSFISLHPHLHPSHDLRGIRASSSAALSGSAASSSSSFDALVSFYPGSYSIATELPFNCLSSKYRSSHEMKSRITTGANGSIESNALMMQLHNNSQYDSTSLTFESRAKQNFDPHFNTTTNTKNVSSRMSKVNQINTSSSVSSKLNLVIILENFYFTKHPLFSEEHIYTSKLQLAHQMYQNFIKEVRVKLICQKIDSVKISLGNLKVKLDSASNVNYSSSSSSSSSPPSPSSGASTKKLKASPHPPPESGPGKRGKKKSVHFSSDIEDEFSSSSPNSQSERRLSEGIKKCVQQPHSHRAEGDVEELNINKDDEIDFTTLRSRITEYTLQLRYLYSERRNLLQIQRNLLNQFIESWNEVQNVRKRSKFISTNIQVELEQIKPDTSVIEEEKKLLKSKIDEEFQVELFYSDHLQSEYLKELKEWKKYKKQLKLKKCQKGHKSSSKSTFTIKSSKTKAAKSQKSKFGQGDEENADDDDDDDDDGEGYDDDGDDDKEENENEDEDGDVDEDEEGAKVKEKLGDSDGEFESETVPSKASASHTASKHMNDLLDSVGVHDEKGQSNDKSIGQKVTRVMSQRHLYQNKFIQRPIEPSSEFTDRQLIYKKIYSSTLLSDARLPGEIIVSRIKLSYANSILSLDTQCPSFERKRRKDVLKRKYQIILATRSSLRPSGQNGARQQQHLNGSEVKKSSKGTILPFDGSFKVTFGGGGDEEDETPHKQHQQQQQQSKWLLQINDLTLDTPVHVTLDEYNSVAFVSTKGKQRNLFNGSIDILPEEWQRSLDTSLVISMPFKWPPNDSATDDGPSRVDGSSESVEGILTFKLYWNNLNEFNLHKILPKYDSNDSFSLNQLNFMPSSITDASVEELLIWKEKYASQLDPYDPDTIKILKFIHEKTQRVESSKKMKQSSSSASQLSKQQNQHPHHQHREGETPTKMEPLVQLKNGKFANLTDELNKPRMKLLLARSSGIPSLKNVPIPLNEREISNNLLNVLDDDLTNSSIMNGSKVLHCLKSNSIESKRLKGILKLKQVKEKLLMQSADRFGKPRVLSDLVHEQASDNLRAFGYKFFSATDINRPLHPVRKERKKLLLPATCGFNGQEIRIFVTVMHAINVPLRSANNPYLKLTLDSYIGTNSPEVITGLRNSPSSSFETAIDRQRLRRRSSSQLGHHGHHGHHQQHPQVTRRTSIEEFASEFLEESNKVSNCFIEATFQRHSMKTSTAEGINPTWNESLILPFTLPSNGDLSPASLCKVNQFIYLNLFDEITIVTDSTPEGGGGFNGRSQIFGDESASGDTGGKLQPSEFTSSSSQPESITRNTTIKKVWLGSLKVPFSTLYLNGRIEGTFKIETPMALLGYEFEEFDAISKEGANLDGKSISSKRLTPSSASLTSSSQSRMSGLKLPGRSSHSPSNYKSETYLRIFLTLDPPLEKPPSIDLKADSDEDESLIIYAKKWQSEFVEEFTDRMIKILAIDTSGKLVLTCRYLSQLKPPSEFATDSFAMVDLMMKLAHFVSLIPIVPDYSPSNIPEAGVNLGSGSTGPTGDVSMSILSRDTDIWTKCDEFLNFLLGTSDQHAILLCNYFLYLGRLTGLIVGSGIPEGSTIYVIVWEYNRHGRDEVTLWNPRTGQAFSPYDPLIPLTSVGCIITTDNIYANIQGHEHPNRIKYDVNKGSAWKALFTKKYPAPDSMVSIQPLAIEYSPVDLEYANVLSGKIEKYLKRSFVKWRSSYHGHLRTFFNRNINSRIRKMLPIFEKLKHNLEITINDLDSLGLHMASGELESAVKSHLSDPNNLNNHQETRDLADKYIQNEFKELMNLHRIAGFPLNVPYSDLEFISESVYATGVHKIASTASSEALNTEFILAVHVHPYPANVFSVWIYIAALTVV